MNTPEYPDAVDPNLVGTYPASGCTGGGLVWDEVLEYRVDNQSPEKTPSGWLSKLDAMEGDQLLRACKKRLRPRTEPS
jgi:hypothetical protein